jgi:hypothetical protein
MLFFYPIVLLLQLPITLIRTLDIIGIKTIKGIDQIAYYCVVSQGLFNVLVYGRYSNFK